MSTSRLIFSLIRPNVAAFNNGLRLNACNVNLLAGSKRYLTSNTTQDQKGEQSQSENKDDESKQSQNEDSFDSDQTVEDVILSKALNHVTEFGFTSEAISRGAMDIGYSSASNGLFKNGAFDLIDFFYKDCNAKLAAHLEKLIQENKITKKNELVREAILYRLSLIQPYIKHWPAAMAVMTFNPSYAVVAIENLLRLCDEIWFQLGDKSTDFNWYTKRLTLAAIYKSTEFFMIQDKSENYQDTAKFLDNRLQDLNSFNTIKTEVSNLAQGVSGSFTVIKNILNIRN